jgi:hypothetical protein
MNKEYYSVSRIENNIAILEFPDKTFNKVDISLLPADVKEGNILVKIDEKNYIHDFNEEKARKERLLELQNKIFG